MKKLILLALVLCSAATMLAQTNRMSYQAVVRNAANELVAEENLTVAISISDANGTSVYSETHSVTSNRNGVISLMIGEGSSQSGNMMSVDWRTAQIHTVITLPGGSTLSNTTPVNAVPYAFYADSVDVQWVSDVVDDYLEHHSISSIVETDPTVPDWAKETTKPAYDYSEIVNTPDLSGYLTAETDPTVPDWAKEANKPAYDYSEIENTPTIPTVPTNVSAFNNDANYITAADIPAIPNNVSTFNNDANYITNSNTSCANSVDLCELLEKLQQLENQLEFKILTEGVTAVTQNSFTVNGKVQTDGSSTVTQRGFVYSSSNPTPSISDYRVNCGSGTGTYSYTVTGLTPGITYYVRAFATNENGTFYGSVVAVTTTATSPSTLPSVTTIAVTNVTTTEATVTGTVTSDGGEPVTQRGFVYGTEPNPTLSSTVANHGTGTGNFSNLLTNLLSGETYYVRAFATNSLGTAYGNQITFVTSVPTTVEGDAIPCPGTPTVTDHEGNVYNTVQIGTQCWTKENMRATTSPSTGTYLIPPAGTSPTYTGKQAWWYDNDSATYAPRNYGLLYNWNAAVDTFNTAYGEISVNTGGNNVVSVRFTGNRRGICPAGWHLPSNAEWTQLENYVGSQSEYTCGGNSNYIAKALASETDWNTNTGNCAVGYNQSSNNVTDFSAVPTGGYGGSSFGGTGNDANFWSSTQYSGNITYSRYLHYNNAEVGMAGSHEKYFGYSVRCLRD